MFIAPQPEIYSREQLLTLRSRAAVLSRQQCLLIAHLGLRRRGCRGGQHRRRRLQPADGVTSPADLSAAIVNRNQLIDSRCSIPNATIASLPVSPTSTSIPVQLRVHATAQQSQQLPLPTDRCPSTTTCTSIPILQPSSSQPDEEDQSSDQDSDSWFNVRSPPSLEASFKSAMSELSETDISGIDLDVQAYSIPTVTGFRPSQRKHMNRHSCCLTTVTTAPFLMPNIFAANIRGGLCNKVDELTAIFDNNFVDIGCISETWLKTSIDDSAHVISNYVCYRNDRADGRQGGGVAVYVKSNLSCTHLHHYSVVGLETLWIICRYTRMPRSLTHILIGVIYHPPDGNKNSMTTHILDCLDQASHQHPNLGIILVGDFNQLPDHLIRAYPLRQVVTSATRGKALLDKIFTNIYDWYSTPAKLPAVGSSDHAAILMQASNNPNYKPGTDIVVSRRVCDHNSKVLLAHELANINWTALYQMELCEDMLTYFYNTVKTVYDAYLPVCSFKRHSSDKPWVTDKFRLLIRRRQFAFQTGNMTAYRKYRNEAQRLGKKLRQQYYNKQVSRLRQSDPRKWWKNVKQFVGPTRKGDSNELEGMARDLYDGDVDKMAEDINHSFMNVASDISPLCDDFLTSLNTTEHDNDTDDYCETDKFVIYPWEVELKLSNICTYKASGPDELPNWLLKEMAPFLADPVCAIFNSSLSQGHVPKTWKQANVIPVPKIHPPKLVENDLRPISLTATLSKILESFVGGWILEAVGHQLDTNQYGARKERSTSHALVSVLHYWSTALDNGNSVRALFVDYSKAFDRVDHNTLLNKMMAVGVPKLVLRWLFSFLNDRQQRVKLGNSFSHWASITGGMPQGTWLGSLIFIIYIDDLKPSCITHKFMDDVTLTEVIAKGNDSADSNMAHYISHLELWSKNNSMMVNFKKTKEMILGSIQKNPPSSLCVSGNVIDTVKCFKLLGVNISDDLRWDAHVDAICAKVASRLYFLKILKRSGLTQNDLLWFYKSVIRSIVEYGCVVWHHNLTTAQSDRLEALQKRALRIILHPITLPYNTALAYSEMESLKLRRYNFQQKFFKQICHPGNCLHDLLPPERDPSVSLRLRHPTVYPIPQVRTKRYCSFINYSLKHYQ